MGSNARRMTNPYLPATPDQISFALDLGIKFDPDVNMGTLSDLIEEAKAIRPPSDEQLRHCAKIGLEIPGGVTMYVLSDLMDARIAELTRIAARNQCVRPGNRISYLTWPYLVAELLADSKSKLLLARLDRTVDSGPRGYRSQRVPLYLLADCREPTSDELAKPLMF